MRNPARSVFFSSSRAAIWPASISFVAAIGPKSVEWFAPAAADLVCFFRAFTTGHGAARGKAFLQATSQPSRFSILRNNAKNCSVERCPSLPASAMRFACLFAGAVLRSQLTR